MADKLSQVMLDEVGATTTSSAFDVSQFKKLSIQVKATGVTTGNGVFTVEVSNDEGTTWKAYNRLITNVNAGTVVSSLALSADGSNFLFFPEGDYFGMIRVILTFTTNGKYSAYLKAV